jgi:hypothetical protein
LCLQNCKSDSPRRSTLTLGGVLVFHEIP